jgi:hypothetical protein
MVNRRLGRQLHNKRIQMGATSILDKRRTGSIARQYAQAARIPANEAISGIIVFQYRRLVINK